MPKISIIVPIYKENVTHLKVAIESIQAQTLIDIEIICVLDGTSDNLEKYFERVIETDCRIKLLRQKNKGAGSARNLAIKHSTGEYIAFMDSDDYYPDPLVLENLYSIAEKTGLKIVGGKALFENKSGLEPPFWFFKNYENLFKNQVAHFKDYQICWGYWCFIYERKFIKENNIYFPNYRRYQDPPWFLRALNTAKIYYAADIVTYIHREGQNQNWLSSNKKLSDHFKGIIDVLRYSAKHDLKDLHFFIYKKFLTHDEKLLYNFRSTLFANKKRIINDILKSVDKNIIKKCDNTFPYFRNYDEYSRFRDQYQLIDH